MLNKLKIVCFLLVIGTSNCDNCKEDQYGSRLELELPALISLPADTITTEDSISISIIIDKEVNLYDSGKTIFLENFDFFTELSISEISGQERDFNVNIELGATEGSFGELPLPTALTYPILYEETENFYRFKAYMLVNETGLFSIDFGSSSSLYERYEHPAMYQCEDKRRSKVTISYDNPTTSEEEFNNLFLESGVEYFRDRYDYERYARLGARTFVVVEP